MPPQPLSISRPLYRKWWFWTALGACRSAGFAGGSLACHSNCSLDTSDCVKLLDPAGFSIATATGAQRRAVVAADGKNFIVVWQDERSGSGDIYGSRVTTGGAVLESGGISISSAKQSQQGPAVAFNGSHYLAVWYGYHTSSTWDVHAARVGSNGSLLDTATIPISEVKNQQYLPAVASDGTNFLVVWADSRSGIVDIYGSRVTSAGTVLDSSGIAIDTAKDYQIEARVAWGGGSYLVVYRDSRNGVHKDIYGSLVSASGGVKSTTGFPICTAAGDQIRPQLAFDGTNFLVLWDDQRSGKWELRGVRVSPTGKLLASTSMVISKGHQDQHWPGVVHDGKRHFVVWAEDSGGARAIRGARVSNAGKLLDASSIAISTGSVAQDFPAVGHLGSTILVVWEHSVGSGDIRGARIKN